ncbi:MAG: type VII secretion protein EccB [Actinomycetota bacterium]|nr:type VII secretion protein EccB [Actinomycetota bacterium]
MSDQRPADAWPTPAAPGQEPARTPVFRTPNAERYVLEADAMRRRQLRSALLHGSTRTWREHRRVWPAVLVGLIVAAVVVAAMGVTGAFRQQQENEEEESVGTPADFTDSGTSWSATVLPV